MKKLAVALVVLYSLTANVSEAKGREPCSGKKGGVSHCSGSKFVCNDGTISKSKRLCSGESGGGEIVDLSGDDSSDHESKSIKSKRSKRH